MRFIGSAKKNTDNFISEGSLNALRQMNMLGDYISEENKKWFELDQERVFDALFLKDKPARAIIPIEFNQTGIKQHPFESFRLFYPDIEINGNTYTSHEVSFIKKSGWFIYPFNC